MLSVAEYPHVIYPRINSNERRTKKPPSSSVSSYEGIKLCTVDSSDSDVDVGSFQYASNFQQLLSQSQGGQQQKTKQQQTTELAKRNNQDESVMCWLLDEFVKNGSDRENPMYHEVKDEPKPGPAICTQFLYSGSNTQLPTSNSSQESSEDREKPRWMTSLPQLNKPKPEQHHFSRLSKANLTTVEQNLQKENTRNRSSSKSAVERLFDEIETQVATLDSQNLLILQQLRKAEALIYDCKQLHRRHVYNDANHICSSVSSKKLVQPSSPLLSRPCLPRLEDKYPTTMTQQTKTTEISQRNPASENTLYSQPLNEQCNSKQLNYQLPVSDVLDSAPMNRDYKRFCPDIPTRRFSVTYYPEPEGSPSNSSPDSVYQPCARPVVSNTPRLERHDRAHSLMPDSERVTKTMQAGRNNNRMCQNQLGTNGTQNIRMKGFVTLMRKPFRRKGNAAVLDPSLISAPITNKLHHDERCTSTGDMKKHNQKTHEAHGDAYPKAPTYEYVSRVRSNEDFIQTYKSEVNHNSVSTSTTTTTGARPSNKIYNQRLV